MRGLLNVASSIVPPDGVHGTSGYLTCVKHDAPFCALLLPVPSGQAIGTVHRAIRRGLPPAGFRCSVARAIFQFRTGLASKAIR